MTKQGYRGIEGAKAMGVSIIALRDGVRRSMSEKRGQTISQGKTMTADQQRIQELEARLRKVEREKDILKKASSLLMSEFLNTSRE
ncbi:MAG: IS3 family transposase [Candidatus Hamiltonella defensa (Ceratovacuna japonica)]|uniref:transposase n=1 Tax=Candidatus Williamhamiltonella defendens TaxID=138072 RepID=UPI001F22F9DA|nr:transposase [Candidatus Hamiltonella defensa]